MAIINSVDGISGRIYYAKGRIDELEGRVTSLLECGK